MRRSVLVAVAVAVFLARLPSARAESPRPAPAPAFGAPPWMGVSMDAGGDSGVKVEHVVRGSPADRGGIRAGDRIVAIDGGPVLAPAEVTRAVGARKVGDALVVSIERSGAPKNLRVVLSARPSSDDILKMDFVGAAAPSWIHTTGLGGAPTSIEQLKGRVVIVDFWASWCGPCRLLAPRLSALKDRYGAQGLTVVGITSDEAERAAVFADKHQMRYPIVVDKDGDTARAYGIASLPTMLLVDKKGIVRDVFVGYDPTGDRLEAAAKKLLAEPAPPASGAPAPRAE